MRRRNVPDGSVSIRPPANTFNYTVRHITLIPQVLLDPFTGIVSSFLS